MNSILGYQVVRLAEIEDNNQSAGLKAGTIVLDPDIAERRLHL
jgi:hypothetical protein